MFEGNPCSPSIVEFMRNVWVADFVSIIFVALAPMLVSVARHVFTAVPIMLENRWRIMSRGEESK
jgi:hypothetical protein